MRVGILAAVVIGAMLCTALPVQSQMPPEDVIWARTAGSGAITLDGVLDEPAWAAAESVQVKYGVNNGLPGSGWQGEGGWTPTDPTRAVIRFLVVDNVLYMGAVVPDSSIGGSSEFNRFDGFLMSLKDHSVPERPAPTAEYFYSWWYEDDLATGNEVGKMPNFRGKFGGLPPDYARDQSDVDAWDAVTVVDGITNSDTTADSRYVVEMKFDLTVMGYDVTAGDGDIVEFGITIYDTDRYWPLAPFTFSSDRSWWQSPWGLDAWYNEIRIHARPDVTTGSGPVPVLGPEIRYPSADGYPTPTIDGKLLEDVWALAPTMDIRFDDAALRESYPGVAKWRSGQYQPEVNARLATVTDPGDATVRWFYQGDMFYLGFDVRDKYVQYINDINRFDGFLVSVIGRDSTNRDHVLQGFELIFQVAADGTALAPAAQDNYLPFLADTLHGALYALSLKGGTTVDTLGVTPDSGYTAELAIDLTKIGYPTGLGDRTFWLGINMFDGDSFIPFTNSYGTRTWWMKEYGASCCPLWGYLDPLLVVDAGDPSAFPTPQVALLGSYPNPFTDETTVRFRLAAGRDVTLEVYNVQGRLVARKAIGIRQAGFQQMAVDGSGLTSGIYMYRLRLADPASGVTQETLSGKMVIMK